jgi:hypothetical protein
LQHKIAFISLFKKEKENSGGANSHWFVCALFKLRHTQLKTTRKKKLIHLNRKKILAQNREMKSNREQISKRTNNLTKKT